MAKLGKTKTVLGVDIYNTAGTAGYGEDDTDKTAGGQKKQFMDQLEILLENAAKVSKETGENFVLNGRQADELAALIAAGAPPTKPKWDSTVSIDALVTIYNSDAAYVNPIPGAPAKGAGGTVNREDAASYIWLIHATEDNARLRGPAADAAEDLGHDKAAFTDALKTEYEDVMAACVADAKKGLTAEGVRLYTTIIFNENLKEYKKKAEAAAKVWPAPGKQRDNLNKAISDAADAIEDAVNQRAAWCADAGAKDDDNADKDAKAALESAIEAYQKATTKFGVTKGTPLEFAVLDKLQQALDAKKPGLKDEWDKVTDKSKFKKDSFKDISSMLNRTGVQALMGYELSPDGLSGPVVTSTTGGAKAKGDSGRTKTETWTSAGIAVGGGALIAGALMAPTQEGKKKWGFARIAAVTAGCVLAAVGAYRLLAPNQVRGIPVANLGMAEKAR